MPSDYMAIYLLFSGDGYEPKGGMNDLVEEFDNKPDLMEFLIERPDEYRDDWWHVADAVKCEIMFKDYEFDAEHRLIQCGDCGDMNSYYWFITNGTKIDTISVDIACKTENM